MRQGHYAAAAPLAVGLSWSMIIFFQAPVLVALACAVLTVWCSTWPDLDHPRFKGKMHPGAALVRGSGQLFYGIRTERDKDREDVHRGPSHCVEWCLLVGGLTAVLTSQLPLLAPWLWFWGASVFLGTLSHALADSMTPSGVPLCATYNYLRHREVWKRHTLNWFSTNSGAEHFGAVPALYVLTVIIVLGMLDLLVPIFEWLVGVMT